MQLLTTAKRSLSGLSSNLRILDGVEHDSQRLRIESRNRGARAVRRITLAAGVLALGVTGVLAAVTASASRTTHAVARRVTTAKAAAATVPAVPEPTATVASGSAPAAAAKQGSAAPQPTPSANSSAPVAVSGGS